jgi:phosphoribosyl-AMP cyclohydrolase
MMNQEDTTDFKPHFDEKGLIPCIAKSVKTGKIVMMAYMNEESLIKTLETGEAWYWSRSRSELWHKGATSGHIQKIKEISIDCDQDCLLISVEIQGEEVGCHTGRESCFYRRVITQEDGSLSLEFLED